jgi:hypothetical protein
MVYLFIWLLIVFAAYACTNLLVIRFALQQKTYEGFIKELLDLTYILIGIVVCFYFLFGSQSVLFLTFTSTIVFLLSKLDYEDTYKAINEMWTDLY